MKVLDRREISLRRNGGTHALRIHWRDISISSATR